MLAVLVVVGGAAAPLAGSDLTQQSTSVVPESAERAEGSVDLANAAEPDDCICCERTQAAMTRYCKAEMVRCSHFPARSLYALCSRKLCLITTQLPSRHHHHHHHHLREC